MSHPQIHTIAAACALALTLAAPLSAQAAEKMREVRDPVTGEFRAPNAAEAAAFEKAEAALRARSGKAQRQPTQIRHPDGSVEMKLDEDTMMYSVVAAGEDGALTMACLPAKEAREFVKATSSKKPVAAKAAAKGAHVHQ